MSEAADPPQGPAGLVRSWLRVVAATAYVPRSTGEVEELLRSMLRRLTDALAAEPFDAAAGARVGELMVEGALTGESTLERSLSVLADGLADAGYPGRAVARLLAAVSAGYAAALRKRTLAQQENMKLALLTAKQRAERDRRATETRFREVFTASAVGIAITDLDGRFVETNPALAAILGHTQEELRHRALAEFLADDEAGELPLGEADRRQLVRPNGDAVWVFLTTSVLRDDGGHPRYRVTMVQDLSELMLLGNQLSHQNLHDALTGVSNRLHFESRLEAVHGQAPLERPLTLLCLDLDAFSMVNTTHGHAAGDRLLKEVANRLTAVVAGEQEAVVARIGGDEFAILVRHDDEPPALSTIIDAVHAELAEPSYDGRIGLAVSATVGAVRCHPAEMSSREMFRAADAALRQARQTGGRQWAEFDAGVDRAARVVGQTATALPAAWEMGELAVRYLPVVRLSDRAVVRVRALAHDPAADALDGAGVDKTTELAELTGLSAALGPWLLAKSTEQVPVWRALFANTADPDEAVHRVLLSPLQSADADLSHTITCAVQDAGIPAGLLEIALDTATVLTGHGDARDNLRTLSDIGVVTALHGFAGGPREIALAERFGVHTVLLADPFEGWRPDWLPRESAPVRAMLTTLECLETVGASVGVLGVRDHAEAGWWADLGVRTAEGPAFGGPGDADDILAGTRPTAN